MRNNKFKPIFSKPVVSYSKSSLVETTENIQEEIISKINDGTGIKISEEFHKILSHNSPLSLPMILLCLGSDDKGCFEWYRAMFLQIYEHLFTSSETSLDNQNHNIDFYSNLNSSDPKRPQNNLLKFRAYENVQLKIKDNSKPVNWIYTEYDKELGGLNKVFQIFGSFLSAFVLYEQDIQYYYPILMKINTLSHQLYGKILNVFILTSSEQEQNQRLSSESISFVAKEDIIAFDQHFNVKRIAVYDIKKSKFSQVSSQILQDIIKIGKDIVDNIEPISIKSSQINGYSITLQLFTNMIEGWLMQPSQTNIKVDNAKDMLSLYTENQKQQYLNDILQGYNNKMQKQISKKMPISIQLLNQLHQQILTDYLQSTQEINISQQIDKHFQYKVLPQIIHENYQYVEIVMKKQLSEINSKVFSGEIKSINILAQEIQRLIAFQNKKYSSCFYCKNNKSQEQFNLNFLYRFCPTLKEKKLETNQDNQSQSSEIISQQGWFLVNQILKMAQALLEKSQQKNKNILNASIQKVGQLETENRNLTKDFQKKINTLTQQQESLSKYLKASQQSEKIMEEALNSLKKNIEENQYESESLGLQQQQKYMKQFARYEKQLLELKEIVSQKDREITMYISQIEREKLLHKKTQDHYTNVLGQSKLRESRLNSKIQQIIEDKLKSQEQLQNISQSSILANSINFNELSQSMNYSKVRLSRKQSHRIIQEKEELIETIAKLEQTLNSVKYQFGLQKQELLTRIKQLELTNKIMDGRILEYENQMIRYQKIEGQITLLGAQKQQIQNLKNQSQKKIALLTQQNAFINQQLANNKQKLNENIVTNEKLIKQIDSLRLKEEQLQSQLSKMKKNCSQEWTQTQDDLKDQQKLTEALKIIDALHQQYQQLQTEFMRYRFEKPFQRNQNNFTNKYGSF